MPRRDTFTNGSPCWVDLLTSDMDTSRNFYCELFGWTADEPVEEFGGYVNFRKDGERVAGCMGRQPGMEAPDGWETHLSIPDVKATMAKALEHGATQVIEPMTVGDLGTMAAILDPSGAQVGVWQPGSHRGSHELYEPNTPSWFELHTRDYDRAVPFYREVIGWGDSAKAADTPWFRYTVLYDGDTQLAGIIDEQATNHDGSGSYWLVYFGTDDVDALCARVRELGGTVTNEPQDTPYGRLASVTDPTGAQFNVTGPVKGEVQAGTPVEASAAG